MPWNYSISGVLADEIRILLNHFGRCHRNNPNFHCICGINMAVLKHLKNIIRGGNISRKSTTIPQEIVIWLIEISYTYQM